MSFIYKRGKTYWYGASVNGRRIRLSLHVCNRRQAEVLKSELDLQYARERLNLRHVKSAGLLEYYRDYRELIEHSKGPASRKRIIVMLNNFTNWAKNRIESLEQVDYSLLKDYILMRRDKGRAAKTIREEVRVMRRFLNEAVADNRLASCDIDFQQLIKLCGPYNTRHYPPFTDRELEIILNADDRDAAYWKVLYYTGLRSSDVGRLRRDNLDRERQCIIIETSKEKVPAMIPVHPAIRFLFDIKTEYLFPDLVTATKRDTALRRFKRFAAKHGINPECTIHSFRHTFNQRLFELGLNYRDRQKLLAHSSSESTKEYTHFDIELTRKYISKL